MILTKKYKVEMLFHDGTVVSELIAARNKNEAIAKAARMYYSKSSGIKKSTCVIIK